MFDFWLWRRVVSEEGGFGGGWSIGLRFGICGLVGLGKELSFGGRVAAVLWARV